MRRSRRFEPLGRPGDQDRRRPPGGDQGGRRGAVRQPDRPGARARAERQPAVSRRAPICEDVPDEKWNDWRWQLSNRVNELAEIEQILELTDEEREGLSATDKFRVDITPYFISLIDPKDPDDPIRRQVIPTRPRARGLHRDDGGLARRGPPFAGARASSIATRTGS